MSNLRLLLFSIGFSFTFSGCITHNPPPAGFTSEGCLNTSNHLAYRAKGHLNVFIETSGSMFGFMPPKSSTDFQTDIWNIVSTFNSDFKSKFSILQVKEKSKPLNIVALTDFREKLNSGAFQASTSTDIPEILDSVLKRTNTSATSAIISDLIFSPDNTGNSAPKLSQITADIRRAFKGKGLCSTIFLLNSNFFRRKGGVVAKSPYYLWIIGSEKNVLYSDSLVKKEFPQIQEIDFGLGEYSLQGTILPESNITGNSTADPCLTDGRYYTLSNFNGEPMEFEIALDLSKLPANVQEEEYLKRNIDIIGNDCKVSLKSIELARNRASTNSLILSVKATHILKLKISEALNDETLIKVLIKNEMPSWVANLDSPTDDLSRQRTFGLKNMINGLHQAYSERKYINSPFKIWISRNSIEQ